MLNDSDFLWKEYFLSIRSFFVLNELNDTSRTKSRKPLFPCPNLKIRRRLARHNNIKQNRKLFPIKYEVKLQNTQIILQGERKLLKTGGLFPTKSLTSRRSEYIYILLLIFVCLKGVDVKQVL
jgi:hypothetical protein